jgi:hypothetical protein
MDVFDHKPEEVLVPFEDEVPQVPLEEKLCPVEQRTRWLHCGKGIIRMRTKKDGRTIGRNST